MKTLEIIYDNHVERVNTHPRETLISGVWWNKEVFLQGYGYKVYMLQFCAMILRTTQPRETLISGLGNKEYFLKVIDTGFICYIAVP